MLRPQSTSSVSTSARPTPWWRTAEPDQPAQVFAIPQLVTSSEIAKRPLLPSAALCARCRGIGCRSLARDAFRGGRACAQPRERRPWAVRRLCQELAISPRRGSQRAHLALGREAADTALISPVDASAMYLRHVRLAWDEAFPGEPLSAQDVILTVPASFDQSARELTLEAARRAGLRVRVLEEPQAAFYDFMHGDPSLLSNRIASAGEEMTVLVCDVGGGTTDLSLMESDRSRAPAPLSGATSFSGVTTWTSPSPTFANRGFRRSGSNRRTLANSCFHVEPRRKCC